MELLFLGTGTSQGVPMIEWDCDGLDLNNPKNWRGRSCAHLLIDGQHVQIDAGYWYVYCGHLGAKPYTYGMTDLVAGESPLETGKLHFVYE